MRNDTNINDVINVIKRLILIDGVLYVRCMEKLSENKIKVSDEDYVAFINDKGEIYLGRDFFRRNIKEQTFIILHELAHEFFEHILRFQNIKIRKNGKIINLRELINIACDLAINSILDEMVEENNKIKALVQTPKDALLPSHFSLQQGRSAEYYLYSLLKDIDKILNNQSLRNFDKHTGDYNNEEDENGNESKNENKNESGNKGKSKETDETDEEIIDINSEEDIDKVIDKISKKIENNINKNKDWGEGSELIKRIIKNIVGSNTINWKKILENKIINFIKYNSNKYIKVIDKKNLSRNVYYNGLPTIIPEKLKRKEEFKVNINIFIDTSGSISEQELSEFIYQICRIVEDIENISTMSIYLFADKIYYRKELDLRNKVNTKDIIKKEIEEIKENIKSGGTSFKEIKEIYDKEKKGIFITFTDGYAEEININKNLNKLFIWIIVNNREFQDKNKNTVIHIEV